MIAVEAKVGGKPVRRTTRGQVRRRMPRVLKGKLPLAVAETLMPVIRERVEKQGKPATQPKGAYPADKKKVRVNPWYADEAELPPPLFYRTEGVQNRVEQMGPRQQYLDSLGRRRRRPGIKFDAPTEGIPVFADSAHMHQRTKRYTYSISGGMWDGVVAVRMKGGGAHIIFRGKSLGQKLKRRLRAVKGRPGYKQATGPPAKNWTDNALKAGTVFRQHKVNVLQPTREEIAQLGEAVAWISADLVSLMLDAKTTRVAGRVPSTEIGRRLVQRVSIRGAT